MSNAVLQLALPDWFYLLNETKVQTQKLTMSEPLPAMGGEDLRKAEDTWRRLAESEARLHLMVELGYMEVGFPDVENFCLEYKGI